MNLAQTLFWRRRHPVLLYCPKQYDTAHVALPIVCIENISKPVCIDIFVKIDRFWQYLKSYLSPMVIQKREKRATMQSLGA